MVKRIKTSFGARYGSTLRKKYVEVIVEYRKPKECPKCNKIGSVKRIKTGLWLCKKCGAKFTGGAYTLVTPIGRMVKIQQTQLTSQT